MKQCINANAGYSALIYPVLINTAFQFVNSYSSIKMKLSSVKTCKNETNTFSCKEKKALKI